MFVGEVSRIDHRREEKRVLNRIHRMRNTLSEWRLRAGVLPIAHRVTVCPSAQLGEALVVATYLSRFLARVIHPDTFSADPLQRFQVHPKEKSQ